MLKKRNLPYRIVIMALVLILTVLLLPACGGDDDEKTPIVTSTATATPVVTAIPTSTITPTPIATQEPVKIGIIGPWSGPLAVTGLALIDPIVKVVEKQVKDQGGILGGREVKFIKYDSRASVAEATAGALKLILDNKVCALTVGGVSRSEVLATAQVAEDKKVLFVALSDVSGLTGFQFSIGVGTTNKAFADTQMLAANKIVKAKTVAILATDVDTAHEMVDSTKPQLQAAGIKLVYEQFVSLETNDYSPYLTKIKFEKPDILFLDTTQNEAAITIAKQIMELGGWDNIKVAAIAPGAAAINQVGAQGWYLAVRWYSGLQNPSSVKYENDYLAMHGKAPSVNAVYFYDTLWVAIKAIEMAGTDTDFVKIAQVARSGKLEWDAPDGLIHITSDGHSNMAFNLARVENKNVVPVTIPE